jgi:hypothetical protein
VSAPIWCAELAADFWARAGGVPRTLPRDIRRAAAAVPLAVVELKGVSVQRVRDWFAAVGLPLPLDEPDRPLRACLVAWRGEGFAFIDLLDDPAERGFSLAHELAHFLRDYLRPRELAVAKLGRAALEVLDGARSPTPEERLHAILRRVPLGPFAHLLRRDDSGRPLTAAERDAEEAADRLAFELLAPAAAAGEGDRADLAARLVRDFGLPPEPAARYAELLAPEPPRVDRAVARLLTR